MAAALTAPLLAYAREAIGEAQRAMGIRLFVVLAAGTRSRRTRRSRRCRLASLASARF
jgi:hypothetical protein